MDFNLSLEQEILKNSVRAFIVKNCPRSYARELDQKKEFPHALCKKIADLGWYGLPVPEAYGGAGGNLMDVALVLEELAYGMLGLAQGVALAWLFLVDALIRYGTEDQKKDYLPRIAKGDLRVAFAITEPDAGTDAFSIRSFASFANGKFILNGNKTFITGAGVADLLIVVTRTKKGSVGKEGISVLLVDPRSPGVEIRRLSSMGRWSVGTYEVFFGDVEVAEENLLGKLDEGFNNVLEILIRERVCSAALSVGNAQAAVDDALKYSQERRQFSRPISKFQSIQFKFARMQTSVDAATLLTYRAAWLVDQGISAKKEASMAKFTSAETWMKVADEGLQILGGYGYMTEYDMERYFRDAKAASIAGGTVELQLMNIASEMGI